MFNQYRNTVNRQRKILRRRYFESKVNHLKKSKPSQWWSSVKRIAGMTPACGSEELLSKLTAFSADSCSPQVLANTINAAFLEPMQGFTRLVSPPSAEVSGCIELADVLQVTESAVLNALLKLNPNKVPGPDCVPSWLLREYADLLAQQRLPQTWKSADVVSIPKEQKVKDISKHLRPISLTPSISKLAEDFVVSSHFGPAVLEVIDPDQFGAIPKSSTTQALTSMLHQWLEATDGSGAAVRVVLSNYRKAFDLTDHGILVQKILSLSIP